jgi:hypothetical protein
MQSDDTLLPSIPPFLRRFEESPPRKLPVRPRNLPAAPSQPARASKPTTTQAAPAAPAATPAPSAKPKVVDMTPPTAAEGPAAQRGRIALAFENQDLPEGADGGAAGADSEDVAFELNLPRGVVRQLSVMAAEKDTTQRAVVLRALRLAGLSVPESSDIDHREPSAERQIQA